ncbi:hypothetical protein T06_14685 [Trichinella sp. T6]|nr:hypothetical protein T06_14685 [Trichinella sp. T6]
MEKSTSDKLSTAAVADCSLKIFLAINQRNLFSTSESFHFFY